MVNPETNLNELAARCQRIADEHGWGDEKDPWSKFGEKIALIHSELSEALEEWRDGKNTTYFNPFTPGKPEGVPAELADVLIRLLHLTAVLDIDLDNIVALKMEYNNTRAFRHGGKRA